MTYDMTVQTSEPALRVGLIGAGKMAVNHLRAIQGSDLARVVGVADPAADPSVLDGLIPKDAKVFATAEELLDEMKPDVVHIVTPPQTHVALARLALLAGAHVYVEKPFTLNRSDAEELLSLAKRQNKRVCAGHQCLFDHAALVAQKALAEIGSIVHVESYFSFRTVRASISPVNQAIDILPHAVYMLLAFLRAGEPEPSGPLSIRGLDVSAAGDVHGVIAAGHRRGILTVTLRGRPIQQYVHIVGTNGCMRVDLVTGAVITLPGPGANAIAAIVNPYRQAWQVLARSTAGFVRHARGRKFGYPGLRTLLLSFYESIQTGAAEPIAEASILDTVTVCEVVGAALTEAEARDEQAARASLAQRSLTLRPAPQGRDGVLVTGAAGFLGRSVVRAIRMQGRHVRALTRRPARFAEREPGVEYRECDLAEGLPAPLLEGISTVVHVAAETKGGKAAHERNSIRATDRVLTAAAAAEVKRFIHISSVAVMRPATGSQLLDETSPVDGSLERGPYVWGKAESERLVQNGARLLGMDLRVVRLGPLVDYAAFQPPGRLGRELGPVYVAVGPRSSRIALIDVDRAADAIAAAVENFDATPPMLNLVEPDAPTRAELVARILSSRPDLRALWLPMPVLKIANPALKLLQRVVLRAKQPLDIAGAFGNPRYETRLAAEILRKSETLKQQVAAGEMVERG